MMLRESTLTWIFIVLLSNLLNHSFPFVIGWQWIIQSDKSNSYCYSKSKSCVPKTNPKLRLLEWQAWEHAKYYLSFCFDHMIATHSLKKSVSRCDPLARSTKLSFKLKTEELQNYSLVVYPNWFSGSGSASISSLLLFTFPALARSILTNETRRWRSKKIISQFIFIQVNTNDAQSKRNRTSCSVWKSPLHQQLCKFYPLGLAYLHHPRQTILRTLDFYRFYFSFSYQS